MNGMDIILPISIENILNIYQLLINAKYELKYLYYNLHFNINNDIYTWENCNNIVQKIVSITPTHIKLYNHVLILQSSLKQKSDKNLNEIIQYIDSILLDFTNNFYNIDLRILLNIYCTLLIIQHELKYPYNHMYLYTHENLYSVVQICRKYIEDLIPTISIEVIYNYMMELNSMIIQSLDYIIKKQDITLFLYKIISNITYIINYINSNINKNQIIYL